MLLEEIKNIKSGKKELREFGITIGIVLGLFGGLFLWREKSFYYYFFIGSAVFLVFGLLAPAVLKPIQKIWMAIALVIGFFMTRVILSILFYLVVTPISFLTKFLGKDILDIKIDRKAASYWQLREKKPFDKLDYERQF